MRDNDSGGFEPEPPKSSGLFQPQLLSEHFQRETPPSPPPAYGSLNRSADSIFGEDRSVSSSGDDDEDVASGIALIANPPHNDYNPGGTNTLYTIFLIVNAALGAGLLNFPKSFDEAGGILVGIVVQASLIIFIVAALLILAYCADQNHDGAATTLQDTMSGVCGRPGRIFAAICVAVYCYGTTITFLILIGDQFDRVIASLYGHDFCQFWYLTREFTMPCCAVIFILPLCYSRRIDFLKMPSTLGVFAIFYLVGLIFYEYMAGNFIPGPIKTAPTEWTDVFLVIPAITFSFQCHVSVIPVYSCMKRRNLKNFTIAACTAIVICIFCYSTAASFGYLTFGGYVNADILMSYSAKRPEVLAGIVAMALKTITTYPILLFCGREALNSVINDLSDVVCTQSQELLTTTNGVTETTSLKRRIFIATPWFASSLVCAILIPNIGEVIQFLGSLAAVFIFIFPGLCLFQVTLRSDPSFVLRKSVLLMSSSFLFMFLGAFIFGVVLTQAIQSMHSGSVEAKSFVCS